MIARIARKWYLLTVVVVILVNTPKEGHVGARVSHVFTFERGLAMSVLATDLYMDSSRVRIHMKSIWIMKA